MRSNLLGNTSIGATGIALKRDSARKAARDGSLSTQSRTMLTTVVWRNRGAKPNVSARVKCVHNHR